MYLLGKVPLNSLFPTLFSLVINKDAMASDYMSLEGGSIHGNPVFMRNFKDWDLSSIYSLPDLLYSFKIGGFGDDKMVGHPANNKKFSVLSCYYLLGNFSPCSFPSKAIWLHHLPYIISFFCWTLAWNKILTIENLGEWNFILTDWCLHV